MTGCRKYIQFMALVDGTDGGYRCVAATTVISRLAAFLLVNSISLKDSCNLLNINDILMYTFYISDQAEVSLASFLSTFC